MTRSDRVMLWLMSNYQLMCLILTFAAPFFGSWLEQMKQTKGIGKINKLLEELLSRSDEQDRKILMLEADVAVVKVRVLDLENRVNT